MEGKMLPRGTPKAERRAHLLKTLDAHFFQAKAELAAEAKAAQARDSSAPGTPGGAEPTSVAPIQSRAPLSPADSARNARADASLTAEALATTRKVQFDLGASGVREGPGAPTSAHALQLDALTTPVRAPHSSRVHDSARALEEMRQGLSSVRNSLENRYDAAHARVAELSQMLGAKEAEAARVPELEAELEEACAKVETLAGELADAREEVSDLQESFLKAQARVAELEEEVAATGEELARKEEEAEISDSLISNLRAQVAALEERLTRTAAPPAAAPPTVGARADAAAAAAEQEKRRELLRVLEQQRDALAAPRRETAALGGGEVEVVDDAQAQCEAARLHLEAVLRNSARAASSEFSRANPSSSENTSTPRPLAEIQMGAFYRYGKTFYDMMMEEVYRGALKTEADMIAFIKAHVPGGAKHSVSVSLSVTARDWECAKVLFGMLLVAMVESSLPITVDNLASTGTWRKFYAWALNPACSMDVAVLHYHLRISIRYHLVFDLLVFKDERAAALVTRDEKRSRGSGAPHVFSLEGNSMPLYDVLKELYVG